MYLTSRDVNLPFFRELFTNYDYIFFVDKNDIKNVYFKHIGDKFEVNLEIESKIEDKIFNINFITYLVLKIHNLLFNKFENYEYYILKKYEFNGDIHKFLITLLFHY